MTKIRLKGSRDGTSLRLCGIANQGVKRQDIPPFFTIEIDLNTIIKREKNK